MSSVWSSLLAKGGSVSRSQDTKTCLVIGPAFSGKQSVIAQMYESCTISYFPYCVEYNTVWHRETNDDDLQIISQVWRVTDSEKVFWEGRDDHVEGVQISKPSIVFIVLDLSKLPRSYPFIEDVVHNLFLPVPAQVEADIDNEAEKNEEKQEAEPSNDGAGDEGVKDDEGEAQEEGDDAAVEEALKNEEMKGIILGTKSEALEGLTASVRDDIIAKTRNLAAKFGLGIAFTSAKTRSNIVKLREYTHSILKSTKRQTKPDSVLSPPSKLFIGVGASTPVEYDGAQDDLILDEEVPDDDVVLQTSEDHDTFLRRIGATLSNVSTTKKTVEDVIEGTSPATPDKKPNEQTKRIQTPSKISSMDKEADLRNYFVQLLKDRS